MPGGGATSGDRPDPREEAEGGPAQDETTTVGERAPAAAGGRSDPAAGRRGGVARARAGRPDPNGEAIPVAVSWDERARRPVAFVWRRRRYAVERVLETWVLETGWWKENGHVSRSYWRVRAGGRVVDLRYDRLAKAWALERELS
ncbi:MAG TPA: DUF6504 family protein [Thermoleophilia bacterium]|nr:DUF6504 family protein [Thermoleophilia bacterium]